MQYNKENVFAKIIRGELPCHLVCQTRYFLAFHDVQPLAPVHVLIVPKGAYSTWVDFAQKASPEEGGDFFQCISQVVSHFSLEPNGFRIVMNAGVHGDQQVLHAHAHILGGQFLGPLKVDSAH